MRCAVLLPEAGQLLRIPSHVLGLGQPEADSSTPKCREAERPNFFQGKLQLLGLFMGRMRHAILLPIAGRLLRSPSHVLGLRHWAGRVD